MGKLIYKKWVKLILILLQTAAAGILVYCILNLGFWMEDTKSLTELSAGYEQTDLFFRQVSTIIENKIRDEQNHALFEQNGELDLTKGIDIQSYGSVGNTVQDMNTTYTLQDLLRFCESGDQKVLHEAISDALLEQKNKTQMAGDILEKQASQLETISPVTGILLYECAQWYSDASGFLLDVYTQLDETSADLYARYREYTAEQSESWSREAPSNIRYCVEESTSGKLYTNTSASSYKEAVAQIAAMPDFTVLYEGERSFNIMVTNPDNVLNPEAAEWFMEKRFVSSNERVYIAIDRSYPVSDILQIYDGYFARRESIVWTSFFCAAVCAVILAACFVLLLLSAGWIEGKIEPQLFSVDRIPTELAASIYMIIGVIYLLFLTEIWKKPDDLFGSDRLIFSVSAAAAYLLFLSAAASAVRRHRQHMLWTNSIVRMLLLTWKQVTAARTASGQMLFFYIIFFVLNFLFLLVFKKVGIFLLLVLDLAVLLFLLRDMAGKRRVWEGIHQISKGDLKYKIDTTALQGETLEMARAVNEMGDGLQEAVDAIIRNERLKAELITNVSHDLKTPLTSIVNYVDLLKREHLEGERVQHYIEVLEQKSQRLKQLTEDLVEASKISSGNIELQMVQMQYQSMIRQAYGEFQERFEERGLTANWDMPKEPVCILADGRQLWRILENLLGNIYKYAKEQTTVQIALKCTDGMAILTLENTAREKLQIDAQELTGRFVRGDQSRNTEGSGLGLSIAQSLTELQGGVFTLSSQEEQFRAAVVFPILQEEAFSK